MQYETTIPFSRPYRTKESLANIEAVLLSDHAHGDGPFTAAATAKLKLITGAPHMLLTTSCTHALELAGLLLDLGVGDEVIIPSFTFPSAADSVALRGATCVFVDIDTSTGNIDPDSVVAAITSRTNAIYVMHYGGVAADMETLLSLSEQYGLPIVEDNAHGLGGTWRGRKLGTLGVMGTLSFHDTKNIHCGEGGAILISDQALMSRAEMIREKGTDRARFLRGSVDKYTWQDLGSSYLPSEFNAAVLSSQLDEFDIIQSRRRYVWDAYSRALPEWATANRVQLMSVPADREHTGHLFYMLTATEQDRDDLISHLHALGISAPFHYLPLDTSPAGYKFGRTPTPCVRSMDFSSRLIRLPLWASMDDSHIDRVVRGVTGFRASV
ncbi:MULTISPECIES: dTDP-4-amino-4,6-dideoxygalactose transaminase [Rhodococcus]|jgi:dTDP-4-amino-4,6-dideoxygalactose transaminase|uniref:dTDP-4-amino-4,6-dideoxygalactose transaminase n=1 Tax=Rhodococcus qingshengii JCM 15477 TaxID=1303681 RepID=A0AB38RPY7_RHOSG|nr:MULTISPECIES: dTDP-4-amino-4,6-dideoxygalactose transaminase [Rhodococcus]MCC4306107.1 dTDP-4-amino-4,6-dideoxygalactose transaminase [Rhodococcus sp. 3-2]UPU46966.1 dTDP-4-amino-4,6-dideoxygalactose transaminase [Rhodococcus qingshengii JCM 15477]